MNKYKFQDVKERADPIHVITSYIELKHKGKEYIGLCPFHNDTTPSFAYVPHKNLLKCQACGWHGDVIDFVKEIEKLDLYAAARRINEINNGQLIDYDNPKPKPKKLKPDAQVLIAPHEPTINEFVHREFGLPEFIYPYRTRDNQLIGYILRYKLPNGKKTILPFTYRESSRWSNIGFDAPRPIYNAQYLNDTEKTVVIVEGEKTTDFLHQKLHDSFHVISWAGGANAVDYTNWAALSDFKRFILIPDNDINHKYGDSHPNAGQTKPWHEQPGNAAMLKIAEYLKPFAELIEWVDSPDGSPDGWDFADSTESTDDILKYILSHRRELPKTEQPIEIHPPKPKPTDEQFQPFAFLGFRKDGDLPKFIFFSKISKTIVILSASAITKQNILNLAPLDFWEDKFSTGKGINVDMISQYLMTKSFEVGIFNESRIRGRGAWVDSGKIILHVGDKLIVDGVPMHLTQHKSKYIYEQGFPLDINTERPIHPYVASEFLNLLKLLSWEKPINAYLLAGWCVMAPFCGALKWRPHIWITGSAGTGKSWVYKNIVRRIIGESAIAIQGKTTEPGIRSVLNNDALPIIFDDTEGENKNDQDRIASILQLMRAASSDDGGVVALGGPGGSKGSQHRIRTMIALASIVVQLKQQSDKSRTTVLSMRKNLNIDQAVSQFAEIQKKYTEVITDDFVSGLHARTVSMLPVILKNTDVFNAAVAANLGEQRSGDQLGVMLAGAYSLVSNNEITFDQASQWLNKFDLNDDNQSDSGRDELRLIRMLFERLISVDGEHRRVDMSIAELIDIIRSDEILETSLAFPRNEINNITNVNANNARLALNRIGMKYRDNYVVISNTHEGVKKLLENTAWAGGNHSKTLLRIEGARNAGTVRFAGNVASNSVEVPINCFMEI